jgi:hypothetical protein
MNSGRRTLAPPPTTHQSSRPSTAPQAAKDSAAAHDAAVWDVCKAEKFRKQHATFDAGASGFNLRFEVRSPQMGNEHTERFITLTATAAVPQPPLPPPPPLFPPPPPPPPTLPNSSAPWTRL